MNSEEFATWFETQASAFGSWGGYVTDTICAKVLEEIGPKRYGSFLKIIPHPRVKKLDSALAKLAKKNYSEPISQMTDLVGTRFVVLLKSDISIVENAIASQTGWTLSRERDPSYEVSQDPNVFDYQSTHYLVRSTEEQIINGVNVPADTACEVQIRTLLQHAYAELVHDNVYKPEGVVPTEAKRLIARCMALMEATDEMFCHALEELRQVNTDRETWLQFLAHEYGKLIGQRDILGGDPETIELLDTYRDLLQLANRRRVIDEAVSTGIAERIARRAPAGGLFSKPMCILVYWLLRQHPGAMVERWPFEQFREDFATAMADVGVARH